METKRSEKAVTVYGVYLCTCGNLEINTLHQNIIRSYIDG